MRSANQLGQLRDILRNHPVVVATTAATAGVLLGGFVVVQALAPSQPLSTGAGKAQAEVAVPKPAPKPPAETTGSAPSGETVASSECDQQTWPRLSRDCMEEYRNKNRGPRVVSTDKLDKPSVVATPTAPADESKLTAPAVWAPAVVSTAPLAAAPPITTASAPPRAAALVPPAPVEAAAPSPVAAPATQAVANIDVKQRQAAKKSKRKAKAPAKQKLDDDDETSVASSYSDASDDDRADRRADRRRIVERWTERDYNVPNSNGDGRRTVTVIRRGGGGFFESLFGN